MLTIFTDIFDSATTHWLTDVSTERQSQASTRVSNTHLSCVMTSLNLIAKHYSEFKKHIETKRQGKTTDQITTKMKLEIPKYVSNSDYDNLNKILGAALPEVNLSR